MSSASLYKTWSLSASTSANTQSYSTSADYVGPAEYYHFIASNTSKPPGVDVTFVNNYLANRAYAHYLATLLEAVPTSQTRLREAIAGKYSRMPGNLNKAKAAGEKLGITLPTVREIPADWREEAAIGLEKHPEYSHSSPPFQELVKLIYELPTAPENYHWASLAAAEVATNQLWEGDIETRPQGSGPNPDETIKSYTDCYTSPEWKGYSKVIEEEIIKTRERAKETGWREEEARALATRYTGLHNDTYRQG